MLSEIGVSASANQTSPNSDVPLTSTPMRMYRLRNSFQLTLPP